MVCQFKSHNRIVSYKTVTHSIRFSPGCISCRFRHTKHNGKKKKCTKLHFYYRKILFSSLGVALHRVCIHCMECNKIVPDRRGENNHGISRSLLLSQLYCFVCMRVSSMIYKRLLKKKTIKKDFFFPWTYLNNLCINSLYFCVYHTSKCGTDTTFFLRLNEYI